MNIYEWLKNRLTIGRAINKVEEIFQRKIAEAKAKQDPLELKDVEMHMEVEKQIKMKKRPAALVGYYNEAISQMSLVVYYACVFPLAPLFSVVTNLIDFDIKLRSLGTYDRRQWSEIASGIGDWSGVMELMSFIAIPLNIAVIYFARTPPPEDATEYEKQSTLV